MAIRLPIISSFDPKGIKKAQGAFGKFGGAVAGIATGAVAAVAGIGTAAARMASDLEQSFAKIEGLVGVSTAEVAKLEEAAIRLGPAYGKSAQEAADALFFITSAGLRGADATDVLEASLKASAAGLGDVNSIANAATAAMNTYGTEVLTGTDAVDALTEAVRLGQLAPEELSSALGKVIPIANELGVSFEETTGLVAGLTRGGLSASEAVTGVRGAMQAILKPTGEAADMLEQYGFSTQDVKDSIEEDGLLNTFGMLRDAFEGNEEDFTRLIGSQEGLNAVLAMTGEASEDYISIVEQMTDDVGALDDAFGAVEETAGFKFERAMETARAALLPVGDSLLEIGAVMLDGLMPVIDMLAPVLEEMFSHLQQPLMDLVGLLPGLLEAFLPLLPVLGELAGMIAELAVALMPVFVALLEALTPILEPIMAVLGTVVDIFVAFAPVLVTLSELLGEMIAAILPIFLELWEQLEEPIMRVIEALIPIIEELLPILATYIEQVLLPILELMADTLGVVLVFAIETLAGWLEWLAEKMDGVGYDFALAFQDMKIAVIEIINDLIIGFETLLNRGVSLVNGFISAYNRIADEVGLDTITPLVEFQFATLDVPGRFDFMRFADVDVEGIGGNLEARFGQGGAAGVRDVGQSYNPGQGTFGGNFRSLGIPALAEGGLIRGPMIGLIGEAGPEAVVPLDKLDKGGPTYNITVQAGVGDPVRIGEEVVNTIRRYERASGKVFASA